MKYRINFLDKYSDETRSIDVEASDGIEAQTIAEQMAEDMKWPRSFKVQNTFEIDVGVCQK